MNGSTSLVFWGYYSIPVALIWGVYFWIKAKKGYKNKDARDKANESGLIEPPSLHPIVDHNKCLGCGSCIDACPEQGSHRVLGLIDEKCHLLSPTYCIGHGACETACPHGAITLVFGTERRGVDIPYVSPTFETDVKGVYIAGELGGMGLIRNAIEQGRQALEFIVKDQDGKDGSLLDVFIVGAGPAGFSATLAAKELNLNVVTVEQDSLGGTVFHYPRGKLVMTAPVYLPTFGKVKIKETTKEELLDFWRKVEKKSGVKINYHERVESLVKKENGFEVKTSRDTYNARAVLLAIGRRGTPRKLGVPGEDRTKVVYRLIDSEQYRGQHVLVVGGGDSALEAATTIAEEPGTTVTLSYRSEAFTRAKEKNRQKVEAAVAEKRLNLLMKSNVKSITDTHAQIDQEGRIHEIKNDAVIVSAGGILPTGFLKSIGITVETKYGTP
ncbi:MAG: NAD(P)-binding domain-containing protein [bacterium]